MDKIMPDGDGQGDTAGETASRSSFVYFTYRHITLAAMCLIIVFISACYVPKQADHPDAAVNHKYMKCTSLKKGTAGQPVLDCHFGYEQSSAFTPVGMKVAIPAESGERLELWWLLDWFEGGKWFPRFAYVLYYLSPCDRRDEDCPRRRIGECHFSEGCNFGHFLAPDANGNGVPDSFSDITWDSWDYGDDDGVEGYLDHFRHAYNPPTGRYTVTKYLYHYPPACTLPVSPRDNICLIRQECKPPYTIFKEEKTELRYFEPSGAKGIE